MEFWTLTEYSSSRSAAIRWQRLCWIGLIHSLGCQHFLADSKDLVGKGDECTC